MTRTANHRSVLLLAGALLLSEAGCHAVRNLSDGFADCAPTGAQPELAHRETNEDYQFDRPAAPPATLPREVAASPLRADSPVDASHPEEGGSAESVDLPAAPDAGVFAARLQARGAEIKRDAEQAVISIDLSNTDVIDADLEHLPLFDGLQQLNLGGTRISNAALDHLSQARKLEFLGLTGTRIDDDGVPGIARLTQLRFLSLAGTDVTDAGLESLSDMRRLEAINLRSTRVTPQGVAALQARLPGCRIVVDTEEDETTSRLPAGPGPSAEPSSRIQRRLYPIPNRDVAQQHLEIVLRRKLSDPEVLHALAALRASEGNWREARASIRCALEQRPDDHGLRFDYAVTLAQCGDPDAAFHQFTRAVGHAPAHHNLGVLLVEQGRLAAARREFEEAIAADPALDSARDWLAYIDGDTTRPPADAGPGLLSAADLHNLFGPILGRGSVPHEEHRPQPLKVDPTLTGSLYQPSNPFEGQTPWFAPVSLSAARDW
jgi:tetratricopeptide (TPR) repeat protein